MKTGKKYSDSIKLIDRTKLYDPEEAVTLVKQTAKAKFDETVEISVRLGVDPRHADQQVRGTVVLPNGTGKTKTVLVIAKGPKAEEATAAGADFVGAEDMIAKIQGGWFGFDVCIATPDMMGLVGRLGRVLGPKGLMPNPKTGTVTMDVTKAITETKAGKVEYRVDKTAIIHCPLGKASFSEQQLNENLRTLMDAIIKAKPSASKGTYVKSAVISTTPGARNRAGGVASPLNTVAFTAAAFVTALQDARTCASPAAGAAGRAGASSEQPTARARQNPRTTPTARDSLAEFRIRGLYHKTASATETVRRVRALPRGGASPARSPE